MVGHGAAAADIPGWDRTRWGMPSSEIAALYGDRVIRLSGHVEFYHLYSDVALRRAMLAGLDFIVYFQMQHDTGRLAQVLLERRKQYATTQGWRDVVAALAHAFGAPTARCDRAGVWERVWVMPTTSVRASFLSLGAPPELAPQDDGGLGRRLLVRYAPTQPEAPACP